MDGQSRSLLNNSTRRRATYAALTVAALLSLNALAFGQAMVKAHVDDPTPPSVPAEIPTPTPAALTPAPAVKPIETPTPTSALHLPPEFSGPAMSALPPLKIPTDKISDKPAEKAVAPTLALTGPAIDIAPAKTPIADPIPPAPLAETPPIKPVPATVAETPPVASPPKLTDPEHKPIPPRTSAQSDAPATAPAAKSRFSLPSGVSSAAQVAAALAIVIGLIFILKAAAKKFVPGAKTTGGKGVIEILARHPLAKNQSLVLVRIGSQIVALNQCKDSSESVLVISEPTEVARIIGQIEGASPTSIQAGFNKLLANARMDLEKDGDSNDRDTDDGEPDLRSMKPESLDEQLEEMAAAKRQLMELRQHVRSVRDSLPRM